MFGSLYLFSLFSKDVSFVLVESTLVPFGIAAPLLILMLLNAFDYLLLVLCYVLPSEVLSHLVSLNLNCLLSSNSLLYLGVARGRSWCISGS